MLVLVSAPNAHISAFIHLTDMSMNGNARNERGERGGARYKAELNKTSNGIRAHLALRSHVANWCRRLSVPHYQVCTYHGTVIGTDSQPVPTLGQKSIAGQPNGCTDVHFLPCMASAPALPRAPLLTVRSANASYRGVAHSPICSAPVRQRFHRRGRSHEEDFEGNVTRCT